MREDYRVGNLYFISNAFFERFSSSNSSMSGVIKGTSGRPHICIDVPNKKVPPNRRHILWFVPISSKVSKYEEIAAQHKLKHGVCDKIQIVKILGEKRAALIQNMLPCSMEYITGPYYEGITRNPVRLNKEDCDRVLASAMKLAVLHKNSHKNLHKQVLLYNNVLEIMHELIKDVSKETLMFSPSVWGERQ